MVKKNSVFVLMVCLLLILCGCSKTDAGSSRNEWDNPYSREAVEYLSSQAGFGKGRTDIGTVALKYIYGSAELSEKYGDTFCVEAMGGVDDGKAVFFSWLYKGEGDYYAVICGDTWNIHLTKSYFGAWIVTDCWQGE